MDNAPHGLVIGDEAVQQGGKVQPHAFFRRRVVAREGDERGNQRFNLREVFSETIALIWRRILGGKPQAH